MMTYTTIQISESIQKKLFLIKNDLERKSTRSLTYNDAIQYLIDQVERKLTKEEFLQQLAQYRGIFTPGEISSIHREERDRENARDRRFNRA